MGREVGGVFRMGNTCTPVANSCRRMAKPIQHCKVISVQLNKFILKKNKKEVFLAPETIYQLQERKIWQLFLS